MWFVVLAFPIGMLFGAACVLAVVALVVYLAEQADNDRE